MNIIYALIGSFLLITVGCGGEATTEPPDDGVVSDDPASDSVGVMVEALGLADNGMTGASLRVESGGLVLSGDLAAETVTETETRPLDSTANCSESGTVAYEGSFEVTNTSDSESEGGITASSVEGTYTATYASCNGISGSLSVDGRAESSDDPPSFSQTLTFNGTLSGGGCDLTLTNITLTGLAGGDLTGGMMIATCTTASSTATVECTWEDSTDTTAEALLPGCICVSGCSS